jgi:hypothetical protein
LSLTNLLARTDAAHDREMLGREAGAAEPGAAGWSAAGWGAAGPGSFAMARESAPVSAIVPCLRILGPWTES